MSDTDAFILQMLVVVGIGASVFVLLLLGRIDPHRWGKRAGEVDDAAWERCPACNGNAISDEGSGVYRCRHCRYEGGPGYAEWAQAQSRAAWAQMSWPERRKAALASLDEARLALISAAGELEARPHLPMHSSHTASGAMGVADAMERRDALETARRSLMAVRHLLDRAAGQAGLEGPGERVSIEALQKARNRADLQAMRQALLGWVEERLARVSAAEAGPPSGKAYR